MPMTDRLAALRLQLVATEMSLRIGNRIRQRREELGIKTQRELADLIPISSVTNQTINKWEKGAHEPGPQYKALLAKALQVDVAYFIADEPQGPTPDLSRLPADQGLADRLDRIEQRIQRLIEEQDERLRRQDEVLARIEAAITRESRVRDEAQAATEALLAAVGVANQALLAGSRDTAEARGPRAT